MSQEYSTIRVRKETKKLLERALVRMEAKLGRRLTMDELLRILVTELPKRNLNELLRNPVSHDRRERMLDDLRKLRREEKERMKRLEGKVKGMSYAVDGSVLLKITFGIDLAGKLVSWIDEGEIYLHATKITLDEVRTPM